MKLEYYQTISQFLIFFGAVIGAAGVYGSYHYGRLLAREKEGIEKVENEKSKQEILHPLFPINFGGPISFGYSKFDVQTVKFLDEKIQLIIRNIDSLKSKGINFSISDSQLSMEEFISLNSEDRKNRPNYLDQFEQVIINNFFPHIELQFFNDGNNVKSNLILSPEDFEYNYSVKLKQKKIAIEFRTKAIYKPVDDKTVVSLYSCLNGECRVKISPTFSKNNKIPDYYMNYIFFTIGSNKEKYALKLDEKSRNKVKGSFGDNSDVMYKIRVTEILQGFNHPF
jgi:hypothetical protein